MPTSPPTVEELSTETTQLLDGQQPTTLVVNVDATNDVELCANNRFGSSQTLTLTPGKSMRWPAGVTLYARSAAGHPTVNLIPNGDGMTPGAADLAAQTAAGYRVVDFLTHEEAGVIAGDGTAVIRLPALDAFTLWFVTRAVVSSTSLLDTKARVYAVVAGDPLTEAALRSGTDSGNFDEAEYPEPHLWVIPGRQLVVEWIDGTPGATVTVSVQYKLAERSS